MYMQHVKICVSVENFNILHGLAVKLNQNFDDSLHLPLASSIKEGTYLKSRNIALSQQVKLKPPLYKHCQSEWLKSTFVICTTEYLNKLTQNNRGFNSPCVWK